MADKKVFERTLTDSLMSIEDLKLPEGDTGPRYYIIIGSFANHENAEQTARIYSRQGYTTTIIMTTNRYGNKAELVSVEAFNDHEEAVLYLREFQSKFDYKAWIYTEK